MVAVIKTGYSIHRIFHYNENKLNEGVAQCIAAENYPADPEKMNASMKLNWLLKRTQCNENIHRNSVHISLNFDVSENHLSNEKLVTIATDYMQQIGFENQPYLVYRHYDAGHAHLHVVTTNIREDGTGIKLHHLGIRMSEPARKNIEKKYGLVVAEAQKKGLPYRLEPVNVSRVVYGKKETKKAIQNVLGHVLEQYRFTSLPELNAVLGLYNIRADRGREDSRTYRHNGLLYRVLDGGGTPVGVPIKASLFYNRPTLAFLQEKFKGNEARRLPHKRRIRNAIDMALSGKTLSLDRLIGNLQKQGIDTILRKSDTGLVYGITYVDHTTKSVFNGSALGKPYSAKAIQERCLSLNTPEPNSLTHSVPNEKGLPPRAITTAAETETVSNEQQPLSGTPADTSLLETLLKVEHTSDYLPHQLKKKKKRKKKGRNPRQNNP